LPRLLLVPRHPERFTEVAQIIKDTGFIWAKRSENPSERDQTAEIILLDSIGELRAVYPLAEIVFVGGSLIPHGGQNILEPAHCRKAIVSGFYTMNFKAIVEEFLKQDALIQLPKLSEKAVSKKLAEVFSELLSDEKRRYELAENAFRVAKDNGGATAKTIENLKSILEETKLFEIN
jgi:3-deoxy-D-manno-octulosonic-acid transferase